MKTATQIGTFSDFQGDVRIYKLSEPMLYNSDDGFLTASYDHVVVSAANVMLSGPETYIFGIVDPEDENTINWSELEGSFEGALNHAKALENAGYQIEV